MFVKNFKIANHGDLATTDVMKLADDALENSNELISLKRNSSESQITHDVFKLGDKSKLKAVLLAGSVADMSKQLNTDVSGDGIIAVPDRDISFREVRKAPEKDRDWTLTYMQCTGNLTAKWNNKDIFYLPIEVEPTELTQITIEEVS